MKRKLITLLSFFLVLNVVSFFSICKDTANGKAMEIKEVTKAKTVFASDVIPFYDQWKLILEDGENVGIANDFQNGNFFNTSNDGEND